MNEELLYFVWKFGLTNPNLQSVTGEKINILTPGIRNNLSGPDFTNARIKVDGRQWFGNVEIHVKSSDWIKHGHSDDRAYDSIILHVVFENDVDLEEHAFRKVPTLELNQFIDESFINKYNGFSKQKGWITCQSQLNTIDGFHVSSWLERLKIERLERKTHTILHLLNSNQGDWEKTFITWLCSAYGFKFNAEPFEMLSEKLTSKMLINAKNVEALLLGLSGLLPTYSNDYFVNSLIDDFAYDQSKWNLESLEPSIWKTGQVRPSNQPTIRIAQLAAFLSKCKGGFWSTILELDSIEKLKQYIQVEPNLFWRSHFNFRRSAKDHNSQLSDASFELIMINCIIPIMFIYGKSLNKENLVQRAIKFLDGLKSESNNITIKWNELGVKSKSAGQSQALLELYNEYCLQKKCLICSLGNKLLLK